MDKTEMKNVEQRVLTIHMHKTSMGYRCWLTGFTIPFPSFDIRETLREGSQVTLWLARISKNTDEFCRYGENLLKIELDYGGEGKTL